MPRPLHELSAAEAARRIESRQLTAEALAAACIELVNKYIGETETNPSCTIPSQRTSQEFLLLDETDALSRRRGGGRGRA